MSHKKLTVVIAFLNESEEVKNTIGSVREWVGDKVDIVVVNDCSDDGYNYDADLKPIDIAYYINSNRMGAARSKEFGISKIKTPYFLLLDAHMRFYDSAWLEILVNTLDQNDRQILCCQTKVLKKSGKRVFEPLEEKFSSKIREEQLKNRMDICTYDNDFCRKCKFLPQCWGPCNQKLLESNNVSMFCPLKNMELELDDYIRLRLKNHYMQEQIRKSYE